MGRFQPGFINIGSGVASLSFVNSATSTSATVTIPTVQDGDLGILFDGFAIKVGGPTPTDVIPTGWTGITPTGSVSGTSVRLRISYKILTAAESGTVLTGMDGADQDNKVLLVFRGDQAIASVTPSTWTSEVTTGNPASQTVSASGQSVPMIVFGMAAIFSGTSAFSTASPAFDATVANGSADLLVGYKIYNSSPSDHSIDMNDLGTNGLVSGYLACA